MVKIAHSGAWIQHQLLTLASCQWRQWCWVSCGTYAQLRTQRWSRIQEVQWNQVLSVLVVAQCVSDDQACLEQLQQAMYISGGRPPLQLPIASVLWGVQSSWRSPNLQSYLPSMYFNFLFWVGYSTASCLSSEFCYMCKSAKSNFSILCCKWTTRHFFFSSSNLIPATHGGDWIPGSWLLAMVLVQPQLTWKMEGSFFCL